MDMNTLPILIGLAALPLASLTANAIDLRPKIFVNPDVTTHIVMPEQLKLVDISTDCVAGDQCTENMVRIKPCFNDSTGNIVPAQPSGYLGTITLIGERHMAQYDLVYEPKPEFASTLHKVSYADGFNYSNPEVSMPENEMAAYAWAISNTRRKYHRIRSNAYGIRAEVFNIYSVDNYFFIDLNLKNKSNIRYDISQMRVFLTDKKEAKATNSQTLELTPAFVLNTDRSFSKNWRQVLVLEKLTFPEEKVLNIEISEDQVSGRVITIPIEYQDILAADGFDKDKAAIGSKLASGNAKLQSRLSKLEKELANKQMLLDKANLRIDKLNGKLVKTRSQYVEIERKLRALCKLESDMLFIQEMFADMDNDSEVTDDDETLTAHSTKER